MTRTQIKKTPRKPRPEGDGNPFPPKPSLLGEWP